MSLRHALRSGVAAACIVGVAAPAMLGASHALAQGPLAVKTGQGRDFTHVEFRWAGGARMTSRREGQVLTVAFNRDAKPNLAELRAMPPRWVKQVESRTVNGRLEIAFTLADGADAKTGQGDGVSFVNFFKAADPPAGAAVPPPVSVAAPARPNAVPANGVVRVSAEKAGLGLNLNFDFAAPAGAAVFRRGEAIWIVFDAAARLDTSAVPASGVQYSRIEALRGPGYSALRIVAPQATLAMAQAQGARWSVTLGSRSDGRFDAISLGRDETSNPPALTAVVAGASQPVWVQDTAVGDRLAVIPALGPAKGLPARRTYGGAGAGGSGADRPAQWTGAVSGLGSDAGGRPGRRQSGARATPWPDFTRLGQDRAAGLSETVRRANGRSLGRDGASFPGRAGAEQGADAAGPLPDRPRSGVRGYRRAERRRAG
jgi:hypothetical protein